MTRLMKTMMLAGTVGLGLLTAGAGGARADIFPTLKSITALGDGTYRWTYGATVNAEQEVLSGDFFTIYDFSGLVTDPAHLPTMPSGWAFSSANVGDTPSLLMSSPPDNSSIPNLTWTYSGPPIPGSADLTLFSAVSIYGNPAVSAFASQGTEQIDQPGLPAGSKAANIGWIPTPIVPEPGTLAVLGMGLAPLAGCLRRRKA